MGCLPIGVTVRIIVITVGRSNRSNYGTWLQQKVILTPEGYGYSSASYLVQRGIVTTVRLGWCKQRKES